MNNVISFLLRLSIWVGVAVVGQYIAYNYIPLSASYLFGVLTGIFMYTVDNTLRGCFIKRAQ